MEIAAAIFSLLSAFLAMKKNIHNWTIGMLGIVFYAVIFWEHKLYADFTLQILFMIQSIQGLFGWNSVSRVFAIKWRSLWISFGSLMMVSFFILSNFTQDPNPFFDSLASVCSLTATYLMIKKRIECWYFWIAADVIYIALFYFRGLHISLVLYIVFLCLATRGYFEWRKISISERKSLNLQNNG